MAERQPQADWPIVGGIDEGEDIKVGVGLDTLINGYYPKRGGLEKRFGTTRLAEYSAVPYGASVSPYHIDVIGEHRGGLIQCGGGRVQGYSSAMSRMVELETELSLCHVQWETLAANTISGAEGGGGISSVTGATSHDGKWTLCAWVQARGVDTNPVYTLRANEPNFNVIEKAEVPTYTVERVHVVWDGEVFLLFFSTAGAELFVFTVDPSTAAATLPVSITNSLCTDITGPASHWDVSSNNTDTSSTGWVVFYAENIATEYTVVVGDGTSVSATYTFTEAAQTGSTYRIAVWCENGDRIRLGWSFDDGATGQVKVAVNTWLNVPVLAHTLAFTGVGFVNALSVCPAYQGYSGILAAAAGKGYWYVSELGVVTGGAPIGYLATKLTYQRIPVEGSNTTFAAFCAIIQSPSQSAVCMVTRVPLEGDLNAGTSVITHAVMAPRFFQRGGELPNIAQCPPEMSCVYTIDASSVIKRLEFAHATNPAELSSAAVSVAHVYFDERQRQIVTTPGFTVITGGVPSVFDGRNVKCISFIEDPVSAASLTTLAAASGIANGQYYYALTLETRDDLGNRLQSIPKFLSPITYAAFPNNTGSLSTQHTLFDSRATNDRQAHYVLWRTVVGGRGPFYRVSAPYGFGSASPDFLYDKSADGDIVDNEQLYTTGNVLENDVVPSATWALFHNERVWLGGTDDDAVWPSKHVLTGELPGFSPFLRIPAWGRERKTGAAILDGQMFVFEPSAIWLCIGDVADDTGAGGNFATRLITDQFGCIDRRSIVVTPVGVMFQSRRGIMMLGRDLSVTFVGDKVLDSIVTPLSAFITSQTYEVSSAVALPEVAQVRFSLTVDSEGPAATGDTLVYDWEKGAWSKFQYQAAIGLDDVKLSTRSACSIGGVYHFVNARGDLVKEDRTTFLDWGRWVPLKWKTCWIKLTSMQGYQRIWRVTLLGQKEGSHTFTMKLRAGYDENFTDDYNFTDDSAFTVGEPFQPRVVVKRQKSDALSVEYEDAAGLGSDFGKGSTFVGVSLDWGAYPSRYKGVSAGRQR